MTTYELTEASFLKDVANHEMQLLRDDGVYRHIRFKQPGTIDMHFDLVTWPGVLCYTGDMGTFVFTRLLDMFEFFRTDRERAQRSLGADQRLFVNHGYWSEKLIAVDGQRQSGSAMEFSEAKLRAYVNETRLEWIREARANGELSRDERRALWEEVDSVVLDRLDYHGEHAAYLGLSEFRWRPRRAKCSPEFEFTDFWDHEFREYTHTYKWCCYALAWGIGRYDAEKSKEAA